MKDIDIIVYDDVLDRVDVHRGVGSSIVAINDRDTGTIQIFTDFIDEKQLAKLYFHLFMDMNSRLSVDKFLSYLPEEDIAKLLFNNNENILFANK